jgi:hypothetical protein
MLEVDPDHIKRGAESGRQRVETVGSTGEVRSRQRTRPRRGTRIIVAIRSGISAEDKGGSSCQRSTRSRAGLGLIVQDRQRAWRHDLDRRKSPRGAASSSKSVSRAGVTVEA